MQQYYQIKIKNKNMGLVVENTVLTTVCIFL